MRRIRPVGSIEAAVPRVHDGGQQGVAGGVAPVVGPPPGDLSGGPVARLVPGVLGDEESAQRDSFTNGGALDHPHFTRPRVWRGKEVPPVLLSGNHAEIERWRRTAALAKTRALLADPLGAPIRPNNPTPKTSVSPEGAEPGGLAQSHAPDRAH